MKKGIIVDQPIIAKIQPLCKTFSETVKEEKKRQAKTNKDIADWTGVPVSNVNKFFSGSLSNPNLFYAVAVCIYLGISLDEAFGIQTKDKANPEKLMQLEHDLINAEKIEKLNEDVISNLRKAYKFVRTLCVCLTVICFLELTAMMIYIYLDSQRPDVGLLVDGKPSLAGLYEVLVLFAAIAVLAYIFIHHTKKKTEKDDLNDE